MLGMVSSDKTVEIYTLSDMTLNCSSLEGLALTSYESLAMGVPVGINRCWRTNRIN